ncbi:MAG: molybdopterin-dependent oxidoreductase, partial [bacterium]|nr:molybdopterin-dependent oxidoreductase [bacterium]
RDQSKCILCGRCVRMCLEVVGASALGFVYRGFGTIVAPSLEKPFPESSCVSCGACIETCPVGALTERPRHLKPAPWEMPKTNSVCTFCGVGCGTEIHTKDSKAVKITGNQESPSSQGSLCFKGKFGFELIHSPERLAGPLVKQGKTLVPVEWKKVFNLVNGDIDAIVKKHGPEAVAVLASGRTSLEEAEGLRSWAAKKGVSKFSSLVYSEGRALDQLEKALGGLNGKSYADLEKAQAILLIGSDPYNQHPVFGQILRQAAKKGVQVYLLSERIGPLAEIAAGQFTVKAGGISSALNGALKALTASSTLAGFAQYKKGLAKITGAAALKESGLKKTELEQLSQVLAQNKNLLIAFNAEAIDGETAKAIGNFLLLNETPENFIALRAKANLNGIDRFVTVPAVEIVKQMEQGIIKAAVLWNEDPLGSLSAAADGKKLAKAFSKLEKLVAADLFLTETAKTADTVLPACAFAEQDGSFINSEGRLQHFKQAIQPICGMTSKQILSELGGTALPGMPAGKKGTRQFLA